ncbi:MAG: hypothetical protein V2I62_04360 [Bacteroidales bacterium]|jgi:hypothetical protein|nr:hypothetical protein [Bacteroidales bacterium]
MTSKKISKRLLREKQQVEETQFRKNMLVWFTLLLVVVVIGYTTNFYWCEIKYQYRLTMLYAKEVPAKLVCMRGDELELHDSNDFESNNSTFYACSKRCEFKIKNHFKELAYTVDAFSGDTINKSAAIIGLKEKGRPDVVYFENKTNFNKYYD